MWDLPGPGLEPRSPALAGGYLTTAPPGKSQSADFMVRSSASTFAQEDSVKGQGYKVRLLWVETQTVENVMKVVNVEHSLCLGECSGLYHTFFA